MLTLKINSFQILVNTRAGGIVQEKKKKTMRENLANEGARIGSDKFSPFRITHLHTHTRMRALRHARVCWVFFPGLGGSPTRARSCTHTHTHTHNVPGR